MSGAFQNIEAERAVIGALLLSSDALGDVRDLLRSEHFTQGIHQRTYAAICALSDAGEGVDEVSVVSTLRARPGFAERDAVTVMDLVGSTPTAANIRTYATQVSIAARLRALVNEAQSVVSECRESSPSTESEAQAFFAEAQARLIRATTFGMTRHKSTREVMRDVLKFAEERVANRGQMLGPPTGFFGIDDRISGLRKKRLHVVAAKTGVGKTALALNIARSAGKAGARSFVVSLEMGTDELGLRALSAEAKVSGLKVEQGLCDDFDFARLAKGVETLHDAPIVWTDHPPSTVEALRGECQHLKSRGGLDLVIVDYLQLMSAGGAKGMTREQEVSHISRGLKRLSTDLDVAVVALSQLNRKKERHEEPELADLRDSGAIEQDANVVIFLWSESDESEMVNWKLAKNRGGALGHGVMRFMKSIQRFEEAR